MDDKDLLYFGELGEPIEITAEFLCSGEIGAVRGVQALMCYNNRAHPPACRVVREGDGRSISWRKAVHCGWLRIWKASSISLPVRSRAAIRTVAECEARLEELTGC
jgi:hypothetical protein